MTAEEKAALSERQKQQYASLTAEEKAFLSDSHKKRYACLTSEQKTILALENQRKFSLLPADERAKRIEKYKEKINKSRRVRRKDFREKLLAQKEEDNTVVPDVDHLSGFETNVKIAQKLFWESTGSWRFDRMWEDFGKLFIVVIIKSTA